MDRDSVSCSSRVTKASNMHNPDKAEFVEPANLDDFINLDHDLEKPKDVPELFEDSYG